MAQSIFSNFTRTLRPTALSAFGLFTSQSLSRPASSCSKFLVRQPSEFAPRECPTPIVLLRAKGIGGDDSGEDWSSWAGMFAERGYTAVEVDIQADPSPTSASTLLDGMVSELSHQIRLLAIPFPPILIASHTSTLLTQSYISNHPASGLVLISPPSSTSALSIPALEKSAAELPEFTFEPHFPLLVVGTQEKEQEIRETNRLVREFEGKGTGRGGKGVTFEVVGDEMSDKTRIVIERWMDRCGF